MTLYIEIIETDHQEKFPGGPVKRTPGFSLRLSKFNRGWETKIPQASWCHQIKKKKKNKVNILTRHIHLFFRMILEEDREALVRKMFCS